MRQRRKEKATDTARSLAAARQVETRRRRLEKSLAALAARRSSTTLASEKRRIAEAEQRCRTLLAQITETPSPGDLRRDLLGQTDDPGFGEVLSSEYPVALFPLRLHTRFVPPNLEQEVPAQLRIRFVPDRIQVNSHQPELTAHERRLGEQYHVQVGELADPGFAGEPDEVRRAAWQRVCQHVGALRAQFVVLATSPPDDDDPLTPLEAFEQLEAWSHAVHAGLLPDRIIVRCSRDSQVVLTAETSPIQEPLSISVDPSTLASAVKDVPDEIAWLVNYDKAVDCGMAVSITLKSQDDWDKGFESVVAIGVRCSAPGPDGARELEELLAAQSFSQGLELLRLGTPTNNSDEDAGFRSEPDPDTLLEFLTEPQIQPWPGSIGDVGWSMRNDGAVLADALGIERETFAYVEGAGRVQQRPALEMAQLVWPATWSYFFDQVFRADRVFTDLDESFLQALHQHFLLYVRARGPLPSFRVGSTPYGVLPVSSLELWKEDPPADDKPRFDFVTLLRFLFGGNFGWRGMAKNTPVIRPTEAMGYAAADPDERLLDILRMQPSSVAFQASPVYGEILLHADDPDVQIDRFERDVMMGEALEQSFLDIPKNEAAFEILTELFNEGLVQNDPRDVSPLPGDSEIDITPPDSIPRPSGGSGQGPPLFSSPLFQPRFMEQLWDRLFLPGCFCLGQPIEMDLPITAEKAPEVLTWLAESPITAIAAHRMTTTDLDEEATKTLLYKVLRHAMLIHYCNAARDLLGDREPGLGPTAFEPLYVGGESHDQTSLELLDTLITVRTRDGIEQEMTVANLLDGIVLTGNLSGASVPTVASPRTLDLVTATIKLTRQAAISLANLPDDELSLLFTEQLDLASYRLDAWVTSLATRRLREQRRVHRKGVHLGAYGWVTDLVRDREAHDSAGYILTPSLDHAKAVAVLHTGYLTHANNQEPYALDLSSERVQRARWTMECIRAGHSLGSVLGYRFERALHERQDGVYLQQFLPQLRKAHGLDQANLDDPEPPASAVVDGLSLREAWLGLAQDGVQEPSNIDFVQAQRDQTLAYELGLDHLTPEQADAFRDELESLDELYDALADATLAESVFQMARGSDQTVQMAELMAGSSTHPPELAVTKTPTSAMHVRQRVIVSFGGSAASGQAGWSKKTPRRIATGERLDAWLGAMLGDPEGIVCEVQLAEGRVLHVSLAELEAAPIDVLSLLDGIEQPQDGVLERLIRRRVRELHGSDVASINFAIEHEDDRGGSKARSFIQVPALATALRHLVYGARPARPGDLVSPELPVPGQWRGIDVQELASRIIVSVQRLHDLVRAAEAAAAPVLAKASLEEATLPGVLDACAPLWGYGIASALLDPAGVADGDPEQRLRLAHEALSACLKDGRGRLVRALGMDRDATVTDTDVVAFTEEMEERLAEISDRQAAQDALQASDQATPEAIVEGAAALDRQIELLIEHCQESLTALFGHRFPLTFEFGLPADHPLAASHEAGIGSGDAEAWMHRLGRIHTALGDWELASIVSQAQGGAESACLLAPTQTPWTDGTPWIGGQLTAEGLKGGVHSVVFAGQVQFGQPFAGLMLAAFNEALPRETEQGGLAFQYDRPSAEPPQAVLLAVAPDPIGAPHWDQDTLFEILAEALDLARIRMVDPDSLRWFGSLLPAMYLTYNPGDQAVSTLLIDEEDMPQSYVGASEATLGGES